MARTVADCALAHGVLTGTPVPEPRLAGLRIGVLTRLPDVAPPAGEAVRDERALAFAEELRALGAEVREAELPAPGGDTWPVFYAEAAAVHADRFPPARTSTGRSSGPSSTPPRPSPRPRRRRAGASCASGARRRARAGRGPARLARARASPSCRRRAWTS
jgi:Asp-tRNA(Asn)/Glu-tRNA(Gln) amidotransferase A subunit family amidase